jgi:raffinose/stachyose/melibiose transport system permease protein
VKPDRRLTPYLFVLPALLVFAMAILGPMMATVGLSFTRWNGSGAIEFIGLRNYARALTDPVYVSSYWHVTVYVVLTIVLEVGAGLLLAGAVSAKRGTSFYRIAFFVPVMLPMVVIAVLWAFVLNPDFGLVNAGLAAAGLGDMARIWLGDPATALITISVVSGWIFAGFYMAIFYSAFSRIPKDIIESARLDGAGEWVIFRRIKVPMVRRVTEVALLLCITGGVQVFDLVFVLTNGGPYNSTEMPDSS